MKLSFKTLSPHLKRTYISAGLFWSLVLIASLIEGLWGSHSSDITKIEPADIYASILGGVAMVDFIVAMLFCFYSLIKLRHSRANLHVLSTMAILLSYFVLLYFFFQN